MNALLIQMAPLRGILFGFNYWNTFMNEDYEDPKQHSLQICLGVAALVITWETPVEWAY